MFIIPARQKQFLPENFFEVHQFVELPLQCKQILYSLDRKLKIHSGVTKSISDKLEKPEEFSHS